MEIRLRALLPLLFLLAAGYKGAAQCSLNPPLSLGNDTILCEGTIMDAGASYLSYLWQDGSTGQTFAADTSGWKYVTVTDGFGCTGTDSVLITVQVRPTASVLPAGPVLVCLGDTLILNGYSPSAYAYLWNDSVTSSDHIVTNAGSFTLVIFDSIGCADTSNTVVVTAGNKPVINVIPPGPYNLCAGDTLHVSVFDSTHYAYEWNDSFTSADRYFTSTGNYYVVVTDSSGCTDTSQTIAVNFFAPHPISLGPNDTLCTGDTLTLNATAGFNAYLWSDSSSAPSLAVTSGGGYWVAATDSNGCISRDTVLIVENPSPVINLGTDQTLCGGTTLTLDAGSGLSNYTWSTGASTQTITVSTSGTYFVQATGANGCVGTSNLVNITADTSGLPPIVFANLTLSTNAYVSYQWYMGGSPIAGANSQNYTPTMTDVYQVVVITAAGCTLTSDTLPVILQITEDMIPQGFSPNADGTNDVFDIPGIAAFPNNELIIFNRWGSEVFRKKPYIGDWNGKSDSGHELEDGTYFYTLDLGNGKDKFSGYIMIRR